MSGRATTTGTLGPGNGGFSRRRASSLAAIVLLAGSLGCMTAKDQKEQQAA